MKINILTLFPDMFSGFLNESIIKRALEKELIKINVINIRDFTFDKHKQVDDTPFGGGGGMVLKPEPLFRVLEKFKKSKIIYTSPQGKTLTQNLVKDLSKEKEITIIAGHYEGIDERVIEELVDLEISIGDYVLTGGELPAMIITDAISRLIPGVLGNTASYENDSFYNGLLDYPHYTRPAEYNGLKVPEVLLSGHHKNIEIWRKKESIKRTYIRRPDLLEKKLENKEFSKLEIKLLDEIKKEIKDKTEGE
ncbi:tRNA (guanine37-N(1)-) methyltransferase [Hypnocyclicus thermotrophus]|uniref:tRNA (guanine-N(1)-)-methyltransferase n=1 Tax=Hypnocyclicus thermotrophus TaxID=1627895 RepID=A0AA46I5I4_9FUSO|nr:tRNA (guanosine(37)-N1)-methyltransferase TrmD [Hypnocyclicus thermotrophus]TDT68541.1 tRNA (guanine37-N(1)-) methyltransferase [Hypnocyclicus thermotrophus]